MMATAIHVQVAQDSQHPAFRVGTYPELLRGRERTDDCSLDEIVGTFAVSSKEPNKGPQVWNADEKNLFSNVAGHYEEVRKNYIQKQSLDDPLTYEPTVLPRRPAA